MSCKVIMIVVTRVVKRNCITGVTRVVIQQLPGVCVHQICFRGHGREQSGQIFSLVVVVVHGRSPQGARSAFSAVLSTEGRVVELCWAN